MSYNRYDEPHTRREMDEAEPPVAAEVSAAPQRIFGGFVGGDSAEYVRADLFDAVTRQRDEMQAEIDRLTAALSLWNTAFWTADQFAVAIHDADGKCYSVRAQDYLRMDDLFHDRAALKGSQE